MTFEQFKKATKEQLIEYGKTLPMGVTRDDDGNVLSYRDSDGVWGEWKYNKYGYDTSYRDNTGFWRESTYKDGRITSFRDSNGYHKVNGKKVSKEEYDAFIKGSE